jgi:hypothetical protein
MMGKNVMRDCGASTIRGRELGRGVRDAMMALGLNGKQVAARLGWTEVQVSRVLLGRRSISPVDMAALLSTCRVIGRERERLMRLCREDNVPELRGHYRIRLPEEVGVRTAHERDAAHVTDIQCLVFPRALRIDEPGPVDLDLATGPSFEFFVPDWLPRTPFDVPQVMSEQLHHVLRASVLPHVSLRLVTPDSMARVGVRGPFTLLDFDGFPSAVYREGAVEGTFTEDPDEVTACRRIVRLLRAEALGEERSRELVARAATELFGAASLA